MVYQQRWDLRSRTRLQAWMSSILGSVDVTIHKFDLSVPIGISYDFNNVQLDLRYNAGLTDILSAGDEGTKNSVFQFTIGYKFGL